MIVIVPIHCSENDFRVNKVLDQINTELKFIIVSLSRDFIWEGTVNSLIKMEKHMSKTMTKIILIIFYLAP